jgi:hypothetical protein
MPDASCQTRAFSGGSIPIVWTNSISGVPPLALPKISSSVGRKDSPTAAARCLCEARSNLTWSSTEEILQLCRPQRVDELMWGRRADDEIRIEHSRLCTFCGHFDSHYFA